MYVNLCILRHLKEELAWAIDNSFRIYVIWNGYATKKIKNKDILNLKTKLYALLCGP